MAAARLAAVGDLGLSPTKLGWRVVDWAMRKRPCLNAVSFHPCVNRKFDLADVLFLVVVVVVVVVVVESFSNISHRPSVVLWLS